MLRMTDFSDSLEERHCNRYHSKAIESQLSFESHHIRGQGQILVKVNQLALHLVKKTYFEISQIAC
jgi:hypothetical protein